MDDFSSPMNDDWKRERRKGIGGSDAAAILGLSPWKSPMDVWLDKMDMAEESANPDRQFLLDLGTELEPVVAKLYTRETGRALESPLHAFVHPYYPILRGNPDRLVVRESRGVELKTENQFTDQFGEPGTDQVPYHYYIQCAHYMAVTGIDVWDVALLHGGAKFSIYTIERDPEIEAAMIGELMDWWERHVIAKVPPDLDGSEAWKAYLHQKFPRNTLPMLDADPNANVLANNLRTVRGIVEEYSQLQAQMENELKLLIGEHEGIAGDFGKITWRKTKDSRSIDWQGAFLQLAQYKGLPQGLAADLVKFYTDEEPGTRRFLFQPRKGWNYGERGTEQAAVSEIRSAAELPEGDR